MSTVQFIYVYLITIPVFFLIDMAWLGFIAPKFYQAQIGFLLGPINWTAAALFYLIYIAGIVVLGKAVLLGAFFGFVAYATYDLTNLATVRDWPILVVVVDMIWGTVLTGAVAAASYYLSKIFVL